MSVVGVINMAQIVVVSVKMLENSSSESENSSSSAEEIYETLQKENKRVLRPRIKNYAESVVACYMNFEFKTHFRLQRTTFEFILSIIGKDLVRKSKGCSTIPPDQQFMIALWKMATMDSYRSVCDRFNVGRATALRAVRRVTRALFKIAYQYISWPSNDRAQNVIRNFQIASGFPKTIGAIDGTHIKIEAPKNPIDYLNRKGYHSIQLQVVCDDRALITHCYVGHPGCVHDQRVFRNSEMAEYLNNEDKFPFNSHIVGDSAYELHEHLLVPFKDNGHLTAAQKHYNFRLSSARVVVERCFALLKGRMRSLMYCLPMSRIDLMSEYIVACCVIHNICILRGDELTMILLPAPIDVTIQGYNMNERPAATGIYKRNMIMNILQN